MKVLIAVDGSKYGEEAIKTYAKFANPGDAVELVSVVAPHYPVGAEPFNVSAEFYQKLAEEDLKQAKEMLAATEQKAREMLGLDVLVTKKVLNGVPGQEIVDEASASGIDLIVVGSHGYGFWQRAWLGSVSDAVVHHANCSVLVVKAPAS
jgi:nucleotide-binding universal stress UspA family protein